MVAYLTALTVVTVETPKASQPTVYLAGWIVSTMIAYLTTLTVEKIAARKASQMAVYLA